jgi:hypothetical protein
MRREHRNNTRRRWLIVGPLSAIVLSAFAFALGMPTHANATVGIPTGIYFFTTPSVPNGCAGSQQADRPRLYGCNTADQRQQWEFTPSPHASAPATYRQVRNVYYNMCLDAEDRGGLTGGVNLRDCNGSANQAWDFQGGYSGGPPGQNVGYVCVWKQGNCDRRLEWTYPSWDSGYRPLILADKYSHSRDADIWYVWTAKWSNDPPNCDIDPRLCS